MMNIWKLEEVLVPKIPQYKSLSQFSYKCQGLGDTLSSCLAYFSDYAMSYLSHLFAETIVDNQR